MGFYLRKSFRTGPIRFNLSRSGVGVSAGVTGARLGMSSTGQVLAHGGRGGIYYRKSLSGGSGRRRSGAAGDTSGDETGLRGAIELTEETGATYGAPEQPEASEPPEAPARPGSLAGGIALCLAVAFLLAAVLGWIPWGIAVTGSILLVVGAGGLEIMKRRAGDVYGRLLDEGLAASDPVTDDARAAIDAVRDSRWLAPADADCFDQRAYLAVVDAGMATGWTEPADLDRLARAEQVLSLDPAFVKRTKLEAYRRALVEAAADHDLTEAEEAGLERARIAFDLSDADLAEELSLVDRLKELRAIRGGVLPRVDAAVKLRSGEVCHLKREGRLLKRRILRSFSRDRQKYKVRGFVIDKAGTLLVTSKRVLLIHTGMTSIALDKIVDLEVDEDRQLLTLTRDGLVTPSYLTTPDALEAGAIIAALTNC